MSGTAPGSRLPMGAAQLLPSIVRMKRGHGLSPHALGRWGEALAAAFLEERGWSILARNFRKGHREIDLVVRKDGLVVFVEVKTRASTMCGTPQAAVTLRKRLEVEAAARAFLAGRRLGASGLRFDVVAIVVARDGRGVPHIEHLEDAWRPGWP